MRGWNNNWSTDIQQNVSNMVKPHFWWTYPSLTKLKARFTKTVCDRPNLLRIEVRGAYGCCTFSSKFRVASIICSASVTRSRYCSNQSWLTYKTDVRMIKSATKFRSHFLVWNPHFIISNGEKSLEASLLVSCYTKITWYYVYNPTQKRAI